ncbi:MAG: hypothetical protein ABI703_05200 [Gemmatimonadales bacterium]
MTLARLNETGARGPLAKATLSIVLLPDVSSLQPLAVGYRIQ